MSTENDRMDAASLGTAVRDQAIVSAAVLGDCPCCGGKVAIDDPEAHERGVGYRIQCEPCYLSMWAFKFEKPESLIRRWNRREKSERLAEALRYANVRDIGDSDRRSRIRDAIAINEKESR